MPSSPALATKASKSSMVPRSGWTASWPPASEPIAHGLPGSSGPGSRVFFGPLRGGWPFGGGGGGEADHVEAQGGDGREPLGRLLEGAAGGGRRALGAGEELVPGAVQGPGTGDPDLEALGAGDVLGRGPLQQLDHGGVGGRGRAG